MKFISGSQVRRYSDEEVRQALDLLRSKGDLLYRDVLRSILFPDEDMINPPAQFGFYLLNSGLTRKDVTIDFAMLQGAIFTHIQLNEPKYLADLEKLNESLEEHSNT